MTVFYYLVNLVLVSSIGYLLWQREPASPLKKYLLPALALKLMGGILLGIFYEYYFGGGDAQLFQTQSDFVTEYARVSPASYLRLLLTNEFESETLRTSMVFVWYSNSYFMVMLLSGLNFITGGHLYLNSFYFSLFNFWGLWQLVKVLAQIYPQHAPSAVFSFLFLPSVVFWASGISKEAIYLGSLGWLLSAALRLIHGNSVRVWLEVLAIFAAGFLLWKIKFYFAALVFALLLSYALVVFVTRIFLKYQKKYYPVLLFVLGLFTASLIISNSTEVFNLNYFIGQLIQSNTVLAERSSGKPMVNFTQLEPTLFSFLKNSPVAVFHTLLRPFIWEGENIFYLVAGLENLFLLSMLLLTLYRVVKQKPGHINLGLLVMVLYVVIIAALIGLSTPNIGSLNRYRTAVLPFVVFLLLSYIQQKPTSIRRNE